MNIHLSINLNKTKLAVLALVLALAGAGYFLFQRQGNSSVIPPEIRRQVNFKTVISPPIKLLPEGIKSIVYDNQQKVVSYPLKFNSANLVVTEQKAPDTLVGSNGSAYFQALGLHPVAQFQVKAGTVAILNFYQTGSLESAGQAGMLVAGDSLVTVNNPDLDHKLTNDQWKQLFDSMKASQ